MELASLPGDRPRGLVAHTIKGKGVSFMEGDNRWHYTRLTDDTYRAALARTQASTRRMVPCVTPSPPPW